MVVFQDDAGSVLKTAFVPHGQAATPPEPPLPPEPLEHYDIHFDGWDKDFSVVNSNLVLKPLWKQVPKNYLVMYFHENGSMLGMESVPYGSPAKKSFKPEKKSDEEFDYPFIGWTANLDKITGDTTAKAIFGKVRKVFIVRFYHEDGRLLKEEKVHYNEPAHPPVNVEKASDPVYHYQFTGWSYPTEHIHGPLNIHALFEEIYNEYTINFYEEEKLHSSQTLHYGDDINYPLIQKKGYDLSWDQQIETVTGDKSIYGSWHFSNTVKKMITTDQGEYQILDPSIHKGKAYCLRFQSKGEKKVVVPREVKLGDYYYTITEIGPYAFKNCKEMEELLLPDGIRTIHTKGLAGCRRLKKVILGKGIKKFGESIFADDNRLKYILTPAKDRNVFGKLIMNRAPKRVEILPR